MSCLLADASTPGLTTAAAEHKMGLTGSPTTQILLDRRASRCAAASAPKATA